ncbi:MAG: hypothetical protein HY736_09880 [Verrucomicrobia bacterium]|nr:hypothetical protein [Verrucomicrobiota bacterium]
MKRRQFIGMAAAGAAGLVWPATARGGAPSPLKTLAHPHLLAVLRDGRVVRDLGRRYREVVPAEDNARALVRAILAGSHATAPAPLPARVRNQVQRDFKAGRTVTLNGWILSVTEARQCALYSLLPV